MKEINLIRMPSTDGHGEHDSYVQCPNGMDPRDAVLQVNEVIHAVNREDNDNEGECLNGLSVEENISSRLEVLGFVISKTIATSNCWDEYDPFYQSSSICEQPHGSTTEDAISHHDAVNSIAEVLNGADGAYLEQTYNNICSDKISYLGDSLFERSSDKTAMSFGVALEGIKEVLNGCAGEDLARTYNAICSDEIVYDGDSIFTRKPDVVLNRDRG